MKRDEESAPARDRSRDRLPARRPDSPPQDERDSREPRRSYEPRQARDQGEPQSSGRGGGRSYAPRNQSKSENFAKDVQPNNARPSAARQEKNARFASATVNRTALDDEEDRCRDSPNDRLSDATDLPSDGDYHSSGDDARAGNGY